MSAWWLLWAFFLGLGMGGYIVCCILEPYIMGRD
jgi:hypothetical protein